MKKYVRENSDAVNLVKALIKNIDDNKPYYNADQLLLNSIILLLIDYCPKEEQDFDHVARLIVAAEVPKGVDSRSDLDRIFEQVGRADPNGLAFKMYKSFKSISSKTSNKKSSACLV